MYRCNVVDYLVVYKESNVGESPLRDYEQAVSTTKISVIQSRKRGMLSTSKHSESQTSSNSHRAQQKSTFKHNTRTTEVFATDAILNPPPPVGNDKDIRKCAKPICQPAMDQQLMN